MTSSKTALEAFEQEKAAILALLVKFAPNMQEYDREISASPNGHRDWSHAGTLQHVREQLEGALQSLTSARENTRAATTRRRRNMFAR